MADMSTKIMLDDTNLAVEEPRAGPAHAIAGYVNGSYANWAAIVGKWGKSGKFLLSIDVQNKPSAGAQCLDVERGDATNADAPGWVKTTAANGRRAKDLRWYPKVYTSESNAKALVSELTAHGVARDAYMLWTAHYGKGEHICGPSTCGCPVQADATQYTDKYDGVSLDASICYGYFFAGPGAVAPKPPVKSPKPAKGMSAPTNLKVHRTGYTSFIATWAPPSGGMETGGHYAVFVYRGTAKAANLVKTYPRYDTKLAPPQFGGLEPDTEYVLHVTAVDKTGYERPDVYAHATFKTAPKPKAAAIAEAQPEEAVKAPESVVEVPVPSAATVPTPVEVKTSEAVSEAPVPSGLLYEQKTLTGASAENLSVPDGTILFIPRNQGA